MLRNLAGFALFINLILQYTLTAVWFCTDASLELFCVFSDSQHLSTTHAKRDEV